MLENKEQQGGFPGCQEQGEIGKFFQPFNSLLQLQRLLMQLKPVKMFRHCA